MGCRARRGARRPRLAGGAALSLRVPAPRLALVAAVALAALGLAAGSLPLLEVPGYELGSIAALAFAAGIGPALGLAAARLDPDAPWRAFGRASAVAAGLLALLFAAAAARAAAGPCAPLFGLPMFVAAAAPSALLACALGVAIGAGTRWRGWRAAVGYAAVAALLLASSVLRAYYGPAAALHDHLFGFWPGPIYDEALVLDRRLAAWRATTIGLAVAAVALADARARRSARVARSSAAVALVVVAAAAPLAGIPTATREGVARALGGVVAGARCTLHFPREKAPAAAERLLRECDDAAAAVTSALGLSDAPRVRVFAYRDHAEKRRLVGAGHTDFTKPWLAEIHVQDEPPPHRILRHEVVHAIASAAAPGPLHVPARARLLPSGGLVEGLAMALAPSGRFSVHQRARALRDLGLAPPMSRLMGDAGFVSAPPARAYVAAGSFVRFLLDRHGAAPVRQVYGRLDFAGAFGAPLAVLESEWNRFLDQVEVPPQLRAEAEARFRHPGLFGMRCAREVAARRATAAAQ